MPNSDTWPRAVSVETQSNMDSARSCDSVISINSACSEDSMEHLSAEEKACLMYLEETIESLDLQEDSGFSNDEPDPAIRRIKHGGTEALPQPDICSNILTVLAENGGPSSANEASSETTNPTSQSLQTAFSSKLGIHDPDLPSHIPPDPTPVPAECDPSLPPDGELHSAGASFKPSPKSEMDLSVIPPPSDFMDEPVSLPAHRQSETSTAVPKPTINLEVLRRRVSEKNILPTNPSACSAPAHMSPTSASSTDLNPISASPMPVAPTSESYTPASPIPQEPTIVSPVPLDKTAPAAEMPSTPLHPSSPSAATSPVAAEPRSPPAVAPKPKKLPPNIILKSHKSTGVHESIMGHPSASDRLLMDPQKVRMEALRKLGLLKSEESDTGPAANPKPLQSRKSWAPASSPLSPSPVKAPPPSAPYTHTQAPIPSPTHALLEPLPDIIPVPAAFCDPVVQPHDDVFVVLSNEGSPALNKKLHSSPGGGGVKSATLERSGLGLSSYMDEHQALGQLRNCRPRPASLGSGKDFMVERPVPAPSFSSDNSQRLPRSQGISVIFSPGQQGEGSRREALKKLGLLRD